MAKKAKPVWTKINEDALPSAIAKLLVARRKASEALKESAAMKALNKCSDELETAMAAAIAKTPAAKLVQVLGAQHSDAPPKDDNGVPIPGAVSPRDQLRREIESGGVPAFAYNFGNFSVAFVPPKGAKTTNKGGASLF